METPAVAATAEQVAINTIRTLAMDGVQKANSGHPGTPMALAPITYLLWTRYLRFDPAAPAWVDRDRFVLSNGHASMLLYATLHLAGYDLPLEELERFRQWGSRTPGHPERGMTAGVEVTTGPLGQGIANSVGLAIAERMLAAQFNKPGHVIVDHHTYCICGDGDLMEGVSYEACSLAGHLGLGKLIVYYDDNKISIAGSTDLAFTEDVATRFEAQGWHTIRVEDVNDLAALRRATDAARAETSKPTLILVRSKIGFGSPGREGTKEAHGEPLGEEEIRRTKQRYGWPEDAKFLVPDEARQMFAEGIERGRSAHRNWQQRFTSYSAAHGKDAAELTRRFEGVLPDQWETAWKDLDIPGKPEATRSSSSRVLQRLAAAVPELVGGSADLDPSTKTFLESSVNFDAEHPTGRNLQFGVREHAMGSITNGIVAHGGLRSFGATFFVFSDYMRPTIRLAALSHLPSIFVFTHDSIGLGEDGPTHQPIEHLASLRAMPGVHVIRPADARETAEAWGAALARTKGPTVLVLSRQNLPQQDRKQGGAGAGNGVLQGAYVLRETRASGKRITLLATGSEVAVAMEAAALLEPKGYAARVVSMPCWEQFDEQDVEYRASVLGAPDEARLAIEAGSSFGWERYTGGAGRTLCVDRFGASAPAATLMEQMKITPGDVVATIERLFPTHRS